MQIHSLIKQSRKPDPGQMTHHHKRAFNANKLSKMTGLNDAKNPQVREWNAHIILHIFQRFVDTDCFSPLKAVASFSRRLRLLSQDFPNRYTQAPFSFPLKNFITCSYRFLHSSPINI
jgi:hypothetical protein